MLTKSNLEKTFEEKHYGEGDVEAVQNLHIRTLCEMKWNEHEHKFNAKVQKSSIVALKGDRKTWSVLKYFEKGALSFLPHLKLIILPWDFFPQTFVFALLQKKRFAHPIWTMRSAYLHSPVLCGQDNSITKDEGKYKIFKKCRSHNTPNEVT